MSYQVRLPSNAGGELKYVVEKIAKSEFPEGNILDRYTTKFTATHRDHLIYEERVEYDDRDGLWSIQHEHPWLKSVDVDEGTDTVTLTGLQRSTTYRVGFYEKGASISNIPYKLLKTRGKCKSVRNVSSGEGLPYVTSAKVSDFLTPLVRISHIQ